MGGWAALARGNTALHVEDEFLDAAYGVYASVRQEFAADHLASGSHFRSQNQAAG